MGRYYSGDIEGKFWFAVQNSNAADRFGVTGSTPNYLTYYYTKEDLPNVIQELVDIKASLGDYFDKFKAFFNEKSYYDDKELMEYLGLEDTDENKNKYGKMLSDYADHGLGIKIKKHLEEFDECIFDAEF
jgi:hypothetical protein